MLKHYVIYGASEHGVIYCIRWWHIGKFFHGIYGIAWRHMSKHDVIYCLTMTSYTTWWHIGHLWPHIWNSVMSYVKTWRHIRWVWPWQRSIWRHVLTYDVTLRRSIWRLGQTHRIWRHAWHMTPWHIGQFWRHIWHRVTSYVTFGAPGAVRADWVCRPVSRL